MSTGLSGRLIVVAGGGGLLGRAVCGDLAGAGARLVVADYDQAAAQAVADSIAPAAAQAGAPAPMACAIDITDAQSVDDVIAMTRRLGGRLDGVVNTAYPRTPSYGRQLPDVTYGSFVENVSIHLGGYFLIAQRFGLDLAAHGGGAIVNIASVYGTAAPRFDLYTGTTMTMPVEYAAIKAGILQLTRYLAQYFKTQGVRVNAVSPGGIADGQPAEFLRRYAALAGTKGMLDPSDVTGAIAFLLSDRARHITGQNVIVDDGFSL